MCGSDLLAVRLSFDCQPHTHIVTKESVRKRNRARERNIYTWRYSQGICERKRPEAATQVRWEAVAKVLYYSGARLAVRQKSEYAYSLCT